MAEAQPLKPRFRSNSTIWAAIGSLVLASIYGRVAVLNLTTGVVGGDIDGYENVWGFYWVKTALLDLHRNPFYTDYIYYPTGVSLRFHALNLFNGLITLPFNLTLGYIPTINLLLVFALFLTCFFSFLLMRDLVGDAWAAFGGAALATYANVGVIGFFTGGQTNLISGEWLPLYIFLMLRAIHGRRIRRLRKDVYAGLAVITLFIMSLTDWQYVMFAVFTSLLYFGFVLVTRRGFARREKVLIFGRLAAIGGIYALVAVPTMLLPMIGEALESPWLQVSQQSILHAADLLDLMRPGLANPGYLAYALALFGLWAGLRGTDREVVIFWALVSALFLIMTLGPTLIVGGQVTGISMPFGWLNQLPVFSVSRDPNQFRIEALLGTSVLVAFGLRQLFAVLRGAATTRLRAVPQGFGNSQPATQIGKAVPAVAVSLFLVVSLAGFFAATGDARVDPPDWPDFYRQIGQDTDTYAILELPPFTEKGRGEDHYQMYQVLHHKPRFGGRWSRDHKLTNPNNFMKRSSLFRNMLFLNYNEDFLDFYFPGRDFLERTDYATQGVPILNYYNVRYIVLYKDAIGTDVWPRYDRLISQVLGAGATPYYEDRLMWVYKVPAAPIAGNPLTLDVGEGWHAAEVRPSDGVVFRWADPVNKEPALKTDTRPSELYTMNLWKQQVQAALKFQVFTFGQPRTLTVSLNGRQIATLRLIPEENPKPVALDITIPPGNNLITFYSPEPQVSTNNANDTRAFSFGMSNVELARK